MAPVWYNGWALSPQASGAQKQWPGLPRAGQAEQNTQQFFL